MNYGKFYSKQYPLPAVSWLASRDEQWLHVCYIYLTIIPWARIGSEAHEAEGRIGYWLRGHEGERNNCFSKIRLVGQK